MFGRSSASAKSPADALIAEREQAVQALHGRSEPAKPPPPKGDEGAGKPDVPPPPPTPEQVAADALKGMKSGDHVSPAFTMRAMRLAQSDLSPGKPMKFRGLVALTDGNNFELRRATAADATVSEVTGDLLFIDNDDVLIMVVGKTLQSATPKGETTSNDDVSRADKSVGGGPAQQAGGGSGEPSLSGSGGGEGPGGERADKDRGPHPPG